MTPRYITQHADGALDGGAIFRIVRVDDLAIGLVGIGPIVCVLGRWELHSLEGAGDVAPNYVLEIVLVALGVKLGMSFDGDPLYEWRALVLKGLGKTVCRSDSHGGNGR